MKVQAYISFEGRTEEAIGFYKTALDAKVVSMMRFKESPEPCDPAMVPPGNENKIMHSSFTIGETEIMASDGGCNKTSGFQGISLALSVPSDADAQKRFAALADGGKVEMPLTKTFFTSSFGIVSDRFGVNWLIVVEAKK